MVIGLSGVQSVFNHTSDYEIGQSRSGSPICQLILVYQICHLFYPIYQSFSIRLTGGTENTLFHYVSWDSFQGIVVCPSDGDTPSPSGAVHAEVVNSFHKTCLSIRSLFSPYYKQVS